MRVSSSKRVENQTKPNETKWFAGEEEEDGDDDKAATCDFAGYTEQQEKQARPPTQPRWLTTGFH